MTWPDSLCFVDAVVKRHGVCVVPGLFVSNFQNIVRHLASLRD